MDIKTVSIVIPVYNEINTLEAILAKVNEANFAGLKKEIVLIDDCSIDGSTDLLKKLEKENKYKVFYHEENQGKGVALRTGFANTTGDIVVIQDADLEYDPVDYEDLLNLIIQDKADVAYGSRFAGGKPSKSTVLTHYLGNKFLTLVTNILYNTTITDMETCYKAFKKEVLANITTKSNSFDFEPEITAKVLKKGYRLYETPISYNGRNFNEGKKITWVDGIWALWTLFKYRFVD